MNVQRNAGVSRTSIIGDLVGYPEPIWHDTHMLSNILSMVMVEKHLPVMYGKGKCVIVDKGGGNKLRFTIS